MHQNSLIIWCAVLLRHDQIVSVQTSLIFLWCFVVITHSAKSCSNNNALKVDGDHARGVREYNRGLRHILSHQLCLHVVFFPPVYTQHFFCCLLSVHVIHCYNSLSWAILLWLCPFSKGLNHSMLGLIIYNTFTVSQTDVNVLWYDCDTSQLYLVQ